MTTKTIKYLDSWLKFYQHVIRPIKFSLAELLPTGSAAPFMANQICSGWNSINTLFGHLSDPLNFPWLQFYLHVICPSFGPIKFSVAEILMRRCSSRPIKCIPYLFSPEAKTEARRLHLPRTMRPLAEILKMSPGPFPDPLNASHAAYAGFFTRGEKRAPTGLDATDKNFTIEALFHLYYLLNFHSWRINHIWLNSAMEIY